MATAASRQDGDDDLDANPGRALCTVFVNALPVSGASISVVGESGQHSTIGASDRLAAEVEAWQFELGEGPHWDALRTDRPALVYDLDDAAHTWPALLGRILTGNVGALFAFPLQLGAATVGVADLYSRTSTAPWPAETVQAARNLADRVTAPAVRLATRSAAAEVSEVGGFAVELRREVHQAAGMVMVQLDCTASAALLRLRGEAFASGVPLSTLARQVIQSRIDFSRF